MLWCSPPVSVLQCRAKSHIHLMVLRQKCVVSYHVVMFWCCIPISCCLNRPQSCSRSVITHDTIPQLMSCSVVHLSSLSLAYKHTFHDVMLLSDVCHLVIDVTLFCVTHSLSQPPYAGSESDVVLCVHLCCGLSCHVSIACIQLTTIDASMQLGVRQCESKMNINCHHAYID